MGKTLTKKTHPLVIGKCDSEGNEGDDYTIYQNTDKEMVRQIKKFKPSKDNFTYFNRKKCNVLSELTKTELLCVDGTGSHFVATKTELKDAMKETFLNSLNNEFNVAEAMEKTFGQLYDEDGYSKLNFIRNTDDSDYNSLNRLMYNQSGVELSLYNGIELTEKVDAKWGSLMFCHLNADGNIVNRDYNIDLTRYLGNKPKNRKSIVETIVKSIPNGKYKYYGNKWYSTNKVIEFFPNAYTSHESDGEMILKLSIESLNERKVKVPSKAIDVNKEHILLRILPLVNNLKFGEEVDLSEYIDTTKLNVEVVPVKRIQKTKINEKKFTEVFNFTKEKELLADEELITALKNIENSIDIGVNENTVFEIVSEWIHGFGTLPSFSFNKGECQEDHSDYIALVKLPYDCNFTFQVAEGDVCEISWAHSIYSTDIVNFELVL